MPREATGHGDLRQSIADMLEPAWYTWRYPDVVVGDRDPVAHFEEFGIPEQRDPNHCFDSAWYRRRYPDIAASGLDPLSHYLRLGAAALFDPHPRFDAAWYVRQHPDAAANPVLYHLRIGQARGYPTQQPIDIGDHLPSDRALPAAPAGVFVDVIVPPFSSLSEAKRCLTPVLAGRSFPLARIIVFDDPTSDAAASAWLDELAAEGQIYLIRDRRRLSFGACVRRGIDAAETHDVVLLHSDTDVSADSLRRLAVHAWAAPRIATVSPLSDHVSAPGYGLSAFNQPASVVEACCRTINAGRSVPIPSAIGACLYIRRDALRAAGGFGDGPGAEVEFCRRAAAAGWQHRLACDTFASRGPGLDSADSSIARDRAGFVTGRTRVGSAGAADSFRFAVTAALIRGSGLPVILMVSHDLGGGIRRHINALAERYVNRAHVFLLAGTERGVTLSLPAEPNLPLVTLNGDCLDDLVKLLRSAGVSRVHIHHLLYVDVDIRRLIHRLDVPLDITVHDYYAVCPQVNLLRWPESLYCGEPDIAGCNACIAEFSSHYATDIVSWRRERDWQFIEADRVICPSEDVRRRVARYGAEEKAFVVPHERHRSGNWPAVQPDKTAPPLRIVLMGVLANHKGARIVASVAEAAEPGSLAIHLIGHLEASFPKPAAKLITATGPYQEQDLDELLVQASPQVFWFPSTAPETYSYTLTTAIESGLPIVAANLGAFPERLAGRPNIWLVETNATTEAWLTAFDDVRERLRDRRPPPRIPRPASGADFYETRYLAPPAGGKAAGGRSKPRIAVLPERLEHGVLTPGAYIRLLQPLDHPSIADAFEMLLVDADSVFDCSADIVITHRDAVPDSATADRLAAHARRAGVRLVYDLDDNLLDRPASGPTATAVHRMMAAADAVWVATKGLAECVTSVRPDARVIETRLDERIWTEPPPQAPYWDDPIRILCMRNPTRDDDFAMIEPVLIRLKAEYGDRIVIDMLSMTLPPPAPGLNRFTPTAHGARSYPGFVDWVTRFRPGWHIGVAPLLDTPFNRGVAPVKPLEYAALGLAVLASDVPAYRGSLADGPAGQLVPNTPVAWHAALDWLIRDQDLRRSTALRTREAFVASGTLASGADARLAALRSLLPADGLPAGDAVITIQNDQSHPVTRTKRHSRRGR